MSRSLAPLVFPRLLQAVPETRDAYEALRKEHVAGLAAWNEQDYDDLRQVTRIHGKSWDVVLEELQDPGPNIVFENILLPVVIGLSLEPSESKRLAEVMAWIEELATDGDVEVSNLIGTGFCEPLITTQERYAGKIIPLMGKATRQLCRELLETFNVSEENRRLIEAK